jgi:hypothetical protein
MVFFKDHNYYIQQHFKNNVHKLKTHSQTKTTLLQEKTMQTRNRIKKHQTE